MKVLIIAPNYSPEIVGCAKYNSELAEHLVSLKHEVMVITAPPHYPGWRVDEHYMGFKFFKEVINSVPITRVPAYIPRQPQGMRRVIHLLSFSLLTFGASLASCFRFRPDLVFCVAPTIAAAPSAIVGAKLIGARCWLHIQDFEVEAAFGLNILNGDLAKKLALGIERFLISQFDQLSTISHVMVDALKSKSRSQANVMLFRNWADVDGVRPLPKNTDFRTQLGIAPDKVVVLYSGNMAAKQGIEVLAKVAKELAGRSEIVFLFAGDGPARVDLGRDCDGMVNVKFLSLQPVERLSELLSTADIHVLPQRPEAADLVLPSKLTGMLASGRPVVAMAMPGSGLAMEVEGCGLSVDPDYQSVAAGILRLVEDETLRLELGASARTRAENRWAKPKIIGEFIDQVERVIR